MKKIFIMLLLALHCTGNVDVPVLNEQTTTDSGSGSTGGTDGTGGTGGTGGTTDTTAPIVLSITPNDAATQVAITTQVVVTFSEAMNPVTITVTSNTSCTGSIQVSANNFTNCIGGTIALSAGNTVATFTPSANLSTTTTYRVRVINAARDVAGNAVNTFTQGTGFTSTNVLTTLDTGCGGTVGITIHSTGDIYTSHNNRTICKTTTSGSEVFLTFTSPNQPWQLVADGNTLYVANKGGNNILRIDIPTKTVTTLVSGLNDPVTIAVDATYLYVGEDIGRRVYRMTKAGAIDRTIGDGTCDWGQHNDYTERTTGIKFCSVKSIARTANNEVYVSDQYTLRRLYIDATVVTITTMSGASTIGNPHGNIYGLTYDPNPMNRRLYTADTSYGTIRQATVTYPQVVETYASSFSGIYAIAYHNGFLYYTYSNVIGKIPTP